jgi:hypothetical protein
MVLYTVRIYCQYNTASITAINIQRSASIFQVQYILSATCVVDIYRSPHLCIKLLVTVACRDGAYTTGYLVPTKLPSYGQYLLTISQIF